MVQFPAAARGADGKCAGRRGRPGALRCPEDADAGRFIIERQRKSAQNIAGEKAKEKQNQTGRERDREREKEREAERRELT